MLKKLLILIQVALITSFFSSSVCFATEKSSQKTVFLIFIKGLEQYHLQERGLPNIIQLKDRGLYYRSVARSGVYPEQCLMSILEQKSNLLLLPRALANNGIDCALLDGSGRLPRELMKKNNIKVITEQNDKLLLDKFLKEFNPGRSQFITIYLDDPSKPGIGKNLNSSQRWSNADNQVGRLLNYLINSKTLDNTTFILTSGASNPPLILFKNGSPNSGYYYCHQSDIAPTICKIFGFSPPAELSGDILYEFITRDANIELRQRIYDLQKQNLQASRKITILQEEQRLINIQKNEIVQERKNFRRTISEKDQIINHLNTKLKIFKFFSISAILVFLAGYIVEYKILRKKFLMFP